MVLQGRNLLRTLFHCRRTKVQNRRFQSSSDSVKTERQKINQETPDGEKNHSQKQSEGSTEVDGETVEMWNHDAPSGPEWGGPRGYEPTKFGDWSKNCRVSDF
ncbi:hypothetical protein GpartN1_g95.t1 [Galdieria partita]|uniref:Succinate dehydrogenase assembly factor 4, mitochondrial n=1 Tax=Galdieria partita TaxID=83374 RepID=A0A9C7UM60_9RHOD|nr:hypothetical protein GpartN1_g95.t1 [Galdieria partita]